MSLLWPMKAPDLKDREREHIGSTDFGRRVAHSLYPSPLYCQHRSSIDGRAVVDRGSTCRNIRPPIHKAVPRVLPGYFPSTRRFIGTASGARPKSVKRYRLLLHKLVNLFAF